LPDLLARSPANCRVIPLNVGGGSLEGRRRSDGNPGGRDGPAARLTILTPREREVVALVAHGLSNDEIATRMVISPTTAKTHVSRAMTKLHGRDRAQLVVYASRTC
jgi:DNA-binding NarL/FixJ family response regulator